MPQKEDRRSALVHPDFIILIHPNGSLRRITMATNMRSKLVMMNGKRLVLTEEADEAGWLMLKGEVDPDVYEQIYAYLKAEQVAPFSVGPFDSKLLPKVCKDRRKKAVRVRKVEKKKPDVDVAALREQLKAEILAELAAEKQPSLPGAEG